MLLEEVQDAFETFTGMMEKEKIDHIAFNMPDKDDNETLAGVSMIYSLYLINREYN